MVSDFSPGLYYTMFIGVVMHSVILRRKAIYPVQILVMCVQLVRRIPHHQDLGYHPLFQSALVAVSLATNLKLSSVALPFLS